MTIRTTTPSVLCITCAQLVVEQLSAPLPRKNEENQRAQRRQIAGRPGLQFGRDRLEELPP